MKHEIVIRTQYETHVWIVFFMQFCCKKGTCECVQCNDRWHYYVHIFSSHHNSHILLSPMLLTFVTRQSDREMESERHWKFYFHCAVLQFCQRRFCHISFSFFFLLFLSTSFCHFYYFNDIQERKKVLKKFKNNSNNLLLLPLWRQNKSSSFNVLKMKNKRIKKQSCSVHFFMMNLFLMISSYNLSGCILNVSSS